MEAPDTRKKSSRKSSKNKSKSSSSSKKLKKSGVRTKFLIESLRNDYYALREENERLRGLVADHLPADEADAILAECFDVNAPKAKVNDIDGLAGQVGGVNLDEEDEEDEDDDAVGY